MPELRRQIRLAAGDYFMHGQDRRMRRAGLPGNICRIALRLDGNFQLDLLRRRVSESPIFNWLGRVHIVRQCLVLSPVWRTMADPPPLLREHNSSELATPGTVDLPASVLENPLHAGDGPAMALDLISRPDGSKDLVLSWNHALMDARGAELVLRHLSAEPGAKGAPAIENLISPGQRSKNLAEWWDNAIVAKGSVKWLHESGSEPLFSLMPGLRPGKSCNNPYRLLSFSEEETARINTRCQQLNAGFRRSHFYLAASIRALHTIATARGNREEAYLVPVPHDMRRRGATGPIFSNHLSILFYRIEPGVAGRLSDIIAQLTRQMMDQIRDRFPESCMAALDMFKPMPLNYYLRHLGKPTRGKFASLSFSDSGETCSGIGDMLGGNIREVTHLVPAWRPPGLTVLFWSFRNQLRALISWVDDCLSPAEMNVLERSLRSGLLEEET
jgi:hypothetical protein